MLVSSIYSNRYKSQISCNAQIPSISTFHLFQVITITIASKQFSLPLKVSPDSSHVLHSNCAAQMKGNYQSQLWPYLFLSSSWVKRTLHMFCPFFFGRKCFAFFFLFFFGRKCFALFYHIRLASRSFVVSGNICQVGSRNLYFWMLTCIARYTYASTLWFCHSQFRSCCSVELFSH